MLPASDDIVEQIKSLKEEKVKVSYECNGCGQGFEINPGQCPKCGSFTIEQIKILVVD